MHKVILILDKFFLKYEEEEGGEGCVKLTIPQEKLPSKSTALLESKEFVKSLLFSKQ